MNNKTKIVCTQKSVTIHHQGNSLIVNTSHGELYQDVVKLIDLNKHDERKLNQAIDHHFNGWRDRIKGFTSNSVDLDGDELYLKGSKVPIPEPIVKTLVQLEKSQDSDNFLPLIRFWKKLSKNPSQNSRKQLYSFIKHNNMSITELGDLVFEKGVRVTKVVDEFVDCHRGTTPYVIGEETWMPREGVADNPNEACAAGLHVAPPSYVRKWYTPSSDTVIIECTVNPVDVVSVPHDYNSSKVRVCRLKVVGYSDQSKTRMQGQVFKISDFIIDPPKEVIDAVDNSKIESLSKKQQIAPESTSNEIEQIDLESKTAREVVMYVKDVTGHLMISSLENKYLKDKKKIIKDAEALLEEFRNKADDELLTDKQFNAIEDRLSKKTAKQIVRLIQEKYDVDLSHINTKNKSKIVKEATKIEMTHDEVESIKQNDSVTDDHIEQQQSSISQVKQDEEQESPLEVNVREIQTEVDLSSMKTKDIVKLVKSKFNESIGGLLIGRSTVISRATELFEEAGYHVK